MPFACSLGKDHQKGTSPPLMWSHDLQWGRVSLGTGQHPSRHAISVGSFRRRSTNGSNQIAPPTGRSL